MCLVLISFFFFFNDTATTEIYTLSLHDALPIYRSAFGPSPTSAVRPKSLTRMCQLPIRGSTVRCRAKDLGRTRSEEHTSELQSRSDLVCRLLLEKKKQIQYPARHNVAVRALKRF